LLLRRRLPPRCTQRSDWCPVVLFCHRYPQSHRSERSIRVLTTSVTQYAHIRYRVKDFTYSAAEIRIERIAQHILRLLQSPLIIFMFVTLNLRWRPRLMVMLVYTAFSVAFHTPRIVRRLFYHRSVFRCLISVQYSKNTVNLMTISIIYALKFIEFENRKLLMNRHSQTEHLYRSVRVAFGLFWFKFHFYILFV
jgi:hypothetical protein